MPLSAPPWTYCCQRRPHHPHRMAQEGNSSANRCHHPQGRWTSWRPHSAGEFEEAIDLIYTGKVDVRKILTKVVTMDETPETIIDIEEESSGVMNVVLD